MILPRSWATQSLSGSGAQETRNGPFTTEGSETTESELFRRSVRSVVQFFWVQFLPCSFTRSGACRRARAFPSHRATPFWHHGVTPMLESTPAPQRPRRFEIVDALRGSALLGLFLLHCVEHFEFGAFPENRPAWLLALDHGTRDVAFFLFGGKAYAIFAMMFGLSFFLILDRAAQRASIFADASSGGSACLRPSATRSASSTAARF